MPANLPRHLDQFDLDAARDGAAVRKFNLEFAPVRANSKAETRRLGALRGKEGAKQRRGLQPV
jgi:hypothetical protein